MTRARDADSIRHAAPTVWARLAGRFLGYAAARGADPETLARAVGLDRSSLDDPDRRISLVCGYDLMEAVADALGDPLVGLHFAPTLTIEDLDVLGFLAMTSPTLRVSLERMVEYQRLWNEGERYDLEVGGGEARLRFEPYGTVRPAHDQMAQLFAADVVVNGGDMVPGYRVRRVRLRQRLAATEEYRAVLGVEVELGEPVDEVVLPEEVLDLPMPGADAVLHRFFERYAREKLAEMPSGTGVLDRLRPLIVERLPEGEAELEALASHLGMSARTLQRRLREEGTSLSAEIEIVRREQAEMLLAGEAAIAEVSWLLGYADPTAFGRAFKRWTGMTPGLWRRGRAVEDERGG